MNKNCLFVGIAGGSGSGKTTVAQNLVSAFSPSDVVLISQDSYYRDNPDMSFDERSKLNYDHPNSIEFELLKQHLLDLANGKSIKKPIYDFTNHARKEEYEVVEPAKVIIVEGILVLAVPEIRKLFDTKIFVDTDADEMLLRRIERDINERGRTFDSVKKQYLSTVKPMFLEFCDPSKRYADVIIPRGGQNKVAINMVIAKLKRFLKKGAI
ncbi:uridine kinase [Hypnocyclicus thermotrophus]|uniref:Uridine kinase n=1 Tax=Hypnocyclicus thermotrophus TaxID=1627895 RepID=A0AA46I6A9_9FUSO|nr:uridine kinase [Hypnocyclicus thermotrophus]TDT72295.1 uridine kinase [Hypnocyclicus thermotrophus]